MIEYIKDSHTRKILHDYLTTKIVDNSAAQKLLKPVPSKLYRYSDLNQYSCSDLVNNHITLSKPMIFNDVYDSTIHRQTFPQIEERHYKLNESLQRLEYPPLVMDMEYLKEDFARRDRHFMTYMTEPMRIGCFSEERASILMWSHYANKNQGICAEYNFTESRCASFLYPVVYLNSPIDMSSIHEEQEAGDIERTVLLSALIKADAWQYEKEWRHVFYFIPPNPLPERVPIINIPIPGKIYLGKNFLRYWITKGANQTFYDFCDYIENKSIPIQIMQNKILSYELIPQDIDIKMVRSLDKSMLYENYLL